MGADNAATVPAAFEFIAARLGNPTGMTNRTVRWTAAGLALGVATALMTRIAHLIRRAR